MALLYAMCGVCVVLSVLKATCEKTGNKPLEFTFKTLASVLFVLIGLAAILCAPYERDYAAAIVVGLVCGLVGDVLLAMDNFTLQKREIAFFDVSGMVFFAMGHFVYFAVLMSIAPFELRLLPALAIFPLFLVLLVAFKLVTTKKLQNILLFFYFFLVGGAIVASISFAMHSPSVKAVMLLFASSLFAFSDVTLGLKNYCPKLKLNKTAASYCIMVTYYTAQCLYALSICF